MNGEKRILIVDDDPQMRLALGEALSRLGYRADTSSNGLEAIKKA